MRLNISPPHFYGIILYLEIRSSTLDQWDVAPDFYLLLAGDYCSEDIIELLKELFTFIAEFNDEIPGASAKDCGNYLDMNLPMARYLAKKYLNDVLLDIKKNQLYYPD